MQYKRKKLLPAQIKEIIHPKFTPNSILTDSPSPSPTRVTFDLQPKVKEIPKRDTDISVSEWKYSTKNNTLIISKKSSNSVLDTVKIKAKKHIAIVDAKSNVILKYRSSKDMDADMRHIGLKMNSYIETKVIINGLSFKETETSVTEYFQQFCPVEKVVLEKNSKGFCTGKATVTFTKNISTSREYKLSGRVLRIERIKRQKINTVRLHISHMKKDINISKLRKVLKVRNFVPENIRIDIQSSGKNKGYGFVVFKTSQEAKRFISEYPLMKEEIGAASYVEFSKEKELK